jgi:hypothetical protein
MEPQQSIVRCGDSAPYTSTFPLSAGETIVAASWAEDGAGTVRLSGLSVQGGVVSVNVEAVGAGVASMTCSVSTNLGRELAQDFMVFVHANQPAQAEASDTANLSWP